MLLETNTSKCNFLYLKQMYVFKTFTLLYFKNKNIFIWERTLCNFDKFYIPKGKRFDTMSLEANTLECDLLYFEQWIVFKTFIFISKLRIFLFVKEEFVTLNHSNII